MDGHHFDHLTRVVSSLFSRRTSFGLLAAIGLFAHSLSASEAGNRTKKVKICHRGDDPTILGDTKKVTKKAKKKHFKNDSADYKGECTASRIVSPTAGSDPLHPCTPNCGAECCSPDRCFVQETIVGTGREAKDICCPAELLCTHPTDRTRDQCCYPGESCNPSLANIQDSQTICCRPCPGEGAIEGCCVDLAQECREGACHDIGTARLARVRR